MSMVIEKGSTKILPRLIFFDVHSFELMSKVCSSSESDAPISSTPDMQPKDSLFTGSVRVCKGSAPGVDVSLGSNFDGWIGPGRKGVTLPPTVLKHGDTLGSIGRTGLVDS